MAKNSLQITHEGNSIQLSWQRGQANRRTAPAVSFEHPFDKKALEDLRWYLEEYLRFPYGIAPERAVEIERKLQTWGEQLFKLVFRSSEQARQFFQESTREGLNQCDLVIISDNPEVLNLPWELLYSPSDRQFLAPSLAGMSRSLSDYPIRAEMGELPQDKLNILLVIARPYGEKDIALKTIARPLLDSVSNIRKKVNIKVLRPPSFDQFERELNDKPGFYHIVHFDGHGNFDPDSQGFQHSFGAAGQGVLVFEAFDGSPQIITAAKIAQNLADCRVPIFVLNACKSAQEGEEKFSSVATRLVSLGAKGVVAMAYSVYAQAAKHFMGRLYGELAAGKSLSTAVSAGRKEVLNQPQRPSPKGDKPLQDWLVPVLYQQENYTPFTPANTVDDIESYLEETVSNLVNFPQEGRYGFTGRDYDILLLERAFRQNNIVLLQGMGGVGKTELAGGFARWLDETQGRSLIFFISFEHGATLSNVVNQVGRKVWGDKFSQYAAEKQQQAVLNYLKNQTCLLIWDNFEPVAGFPAGNEPLLSANERDNLQRFLKDLRSGKSWVLITSRREESWLDCAYSLNLQGLREQDVEELAAKILQMVGVDRAKLPKEYLDLLKLLGGHPLSLRVILPHLKTQTPSQLIEALRLGLDTFSGAEEEGRDKSLTVSLDYSFAKLSEQARRHLPFLGLFSERVSVDWLHLFSESSDNEYGHSYQEVFGTQMQKADWLRILHEATEVGILEHLAENLYKIHPALPWYLRQKLVSTHSREVISKIEKKLLIFYAMWADQYREQLVHNTQQATSIFIFEEPNFLQNLRLAEQFQKWDQAHFILQFLGKIYEKLGRKSELKSLRQQALIQVGIYLAEAKRKGESAFNFWIYLQVVDIEELVESTDIEKAQRNYQIILNDLITLNDSSVNDQIAVMYDNLGRIADKKRDFEEALNYYLKAIEIYKGSKKLYEAAGVYYEIGMTYLQQRELKQAHKSYRKALIIHKCAGDWYEVAHDYYGMGQVAEEEHNFDLATHYYQEACGIFQGHQDFHRVALAYHQLGGIALQLKNYKKAKNFYIKALKFFEDIGNDYRVALVYQNLGTLSWMNQEPDYEAAINYYQKGFAILNKFQHWREASLTLGNWGRALEAQKNYIEALKIYIRFWRMNFEYQLEWINGSIKALARILKQLGANQFETIWREVIGEDCGGEIRDAIWSVRDNLE